MPYDPADRDEESELRAQAPQDDTEEMTWVEEVRALFGRDVDPDDRTLTEKAVNRVFGTSLKGWEMAKAVRHCAMRKASYPPNGQEIIDAIKQGRIEYKIRQSTSVDNTHHVCLRMTTMLDERGEPLKSEAVRYIEGPDSWRRRLENATPEERFSIICEPDQDTHCRQRAEYAMRLRGGFIPLDTSTWIEAIRDIVATLNKMLRAPKAKLS